LDDLHDSDQLVIRALPSSRSASSARLELELRRGLRRALAAAGRQP
jgi:ribonuclease P protein component